METMDLLPAGRVRDLVSTADRQLAARSYDAAIDTYRTALAELTAETTAPVRADIESRLAAAVGKRETSERVAGLLARARYAQTAGRLSDAFAAVAEARSLDPSDEASSQLRLQLLNAMPELATQSKAPIHEVAPVTDVAPAETPALPNIVQAQTAAEESPAVARLEPEPARPEPDQRPIDPPSFRLLESDDPLLERPRRRGYAAEPELLSILDPAPHPEPHGCMRGEARRSITIVIAVLVSMAIGSAVYRGTRRMNRYMPPATSTLADPASSGDGPVYRAGGGVTVPALRFKVEPDYPEEARRAKYQGTVVLYLEIDPRGTPVHIKVLRGLDMGLSERAVEAVRKWRFRPGMKDGRPVTTQATVEVHFRLL